MLPIKRFQSFGAALAVAFCLCAMNSAAQVQEAKRLVFSHAFAPADPMTAPVEKPYRDDLLLNGRWQFQAMPLPAGFVRDQGNPPTLPPPSPDGWDKTPIKIPSPWNVNTWGNGRHVTEDGVTPGAGTDRSYFASSLYYPSYPEAWDHAEMAWMQRTFRVPSAWASKRVFLHFDAVAGDCEVIVNGKSAGHHFDSFLPFEFDVTELVNKTGDNTLQVGVREANLFNKRSKNYPKFAKPYPDGSNLDGLCGIGQDVSLRAVPAVHISDVFVQPLVSQGRLKAQITVRNDTDAEQSLTVGGEVRTWVNLAPQPTGKTNTVAAELTAPEPQWKLGPTVLTLPRAAVTVPPHSGATVTLTVPAPPGMKQWTPQTPHLYGAGLAAGENRPACSSAA